MLTLLALNSYWQLEIALTATTAITEDCMMFLVSAIYMFRKKYIKGNMQSQCFY